MSFYLKYLVIWKICRILHYIKQLTSGMGGNPNTNNMTQSKTQKSVGSFLTVKQLQKLKFQIEGDNSPVLFEISYNEETGTQFYETNTGGDDVKFSLQFTGNENDGFNLIIVVGGIGIWSTTTLYQVSDENKISDSEFKLIKLLIKNFTDSIGNSVYIK